MLIDARGRKINIVCNKKKSNGRCPAPRRDVGVDASRDFLGGRWSASAPRCGWNAACAADSKRDLPGQMFAPTGAADEEFLVLVLRILCAGSVRRISANSTGAALEVTTPAGDEKFPSHSNRAGQTKSNSGDPQPTTMQVGGLTTEPITIDYPSGTPGRA